MLKVNKIMVPRDFSRCAEQALQQGLWLARETGATLHVVYAEVLYAKAFDVPAYTTDYEENLRARLLDVETSTAAEGVRLEPAVIRDIAVAPALLRYAEEQDIDLIVMGTHGRRGVRRWLLGSTAEEVVRLAPCPVWTTRSSEVEAPAKGRLLVPIDFSSHSRVALEQALALAPVLEASLDVLHVVEEYLHPAFYNTGVTSIYHIEPDLNERALAHLQAFYTEAGGPEAGVTFHVRTGQAAREIVRFAEEEAVALIVMSTHGLTGLEHVFLGSVAERVVRRSPVPVLTVKPSGTSIAVSSSLEDAATP